MKLQLQVSELTGILLWGQEEAVVFVVLPSGHTERDPLSVCTVELVGLLVGMKVGGHIRLLLDISPFILLTCV